MICKNCGNEFDESYFDKCPYCLSPIFNDVSSKTDCKKGVKSVVELDDEEFLKVFESCEVCEDEFDDKKITSFESFVEEIGLGNELASVLKKIDINNIDQFVDFFGSNNFFSSETSKNKCDKNERFKQIDERLITKKKNRDKLNGFEKKTKKNHLLFKNIQLKEFLFSNISKDVEILDISAMTELGMTSGEVRKLRDDKINFCGDLKKIPTKHFVELFGKQKTFFRFPEIVAILENDTKYILKYVLDKHKGSRECLIFLRRAKGDTLQEIGDNPPGGGESLTRERIRQIENKFIMAFRPFVTWLFHKLKSSNECLLVEDVMNLFENNEYNQIVLYVMKSMEEFEFIDFAELFIVKKEYSVANKFADVVLEIVDEGTDLSDDKDIIENAIVDNNLDYFKFENVKGLLEKEGYHFYGDFATKGKVAYSNICSYIVRKYFPNGIKLTQYETEKTEDLAKLRGIVNEKYKNVELPASDRTLSTLLMRKDLVLRAPGTYIPQENILIDKELFNEIIDFIDSANIEKLFYSEIYARFEGALKAMCNIDNYNYLHGILKTFYPDSYDYYKFYLSKKGALHQKNLTYLKEYIFLSAT